MTVRTVNNLPAATHGETVQCLFAIELSKKSWVIGLMTPLSEKISRRTLKGCDWKGLLELIEEVRARVSRETGRAVDVISCYEAGYDGFSLHRCESAPKRDPGQNGSKTRRGGPHRRRSDPTRNKISLNVSWS